VRQELTRKRKELVEAEKVAMRTGSNGRVHFLKLEIATLVDKENRLWFQRSKVLWAKFGDETPNFTTATPHKEKGRI